LWVYERVNVPFLDERVSIFYKHFCGEPPVKTEIESTFERILLVNDKFPRDPNNHTTQDPEHLIER
jgi:hypothetical protein